MYLENIVLAEVSRYPNFQLDVSSHSRDTFAWNCVGNPLYQENHSTTVYVVPPSIVSCSPDTSFAFSGTFFFSFTRCCCLNIFGKPLYQENRSTTVFVRPPPIVSFSSGTNSEFSATYSFSFT